MVPGKVVSKHTKKDYAEPHKIPLSGQHRNHSSEGQINIKHIFNLSKYVEIKGYSHATPKKIFLQRIKKRYHRTTGQDKLGVANLNSIFFWNK